MKMFSSFAVIFSILFKNSQKYSCRYIFKISNCGKKPSKAENDLIELCDLWQQVQNCVLGRCSSKNKLAVAIMCFNKPLKSPTTKRNEKLNLFRIVVFCRGKWFFESVLSDPCNVIFPQLTIS